MSTAGPGQGLIGGHTKGLIGGNCFDICLDFVGFKFGIFGIFAKALCFELFVVLLELPQ